MNNLPLDATGMREAVAVAKRLGERKGIFGVSSSTRTRAVQTAAEILKYSPTANMLDVTSALEPWHLGGFEGEPSSQAQEKLKAYVKNPTMVVPGTGAASKVPGESLESFLKRFLPYLKKQVLSNPHGYGLILCCHYRNIKAAKAWVKGGAKSDFSVDPNEMLALEKAEPASLWCVEYENGKWVVEPEDLFGEDDPLDDVYLLRHGKTAFNDDSSSPKVLAGGS